MLCSLQRLRGLFGFQTALGSAFFSSCTSHTFLFFPLSPLLQFQMAVEVTQGHCLWDKVHSGMSTAVGPDRAQCRPWGSWICWRRGEAARFLLSHFSPLPSGISHLCSYRKSGGEKDGVSHLRFPKGSLGQDSHPWCVWQAAVTWPTLTSAQRAGRLLSWAPHVSEWPGRGGPFSVRSFTASSVFSWPMFYNVEMIELPSCFCEVNRRINISSILKSNFGNFFVMKNESK